MSPRPAPRRPLNPLLLRRAYRCGATQRAIALFAGFTSYNQYYTALRTPTIAATPLMVERLLRIADVVGLPRDEVFLDAPLPRPAERSAAPGEATQ